MKGSSKNSNDLIMNKFKICLDIQVCRAYNKYFEHVMGAGSG